MKILMLTGCMESGGAETHIAMLTEGLHQRGVDVSLLSEDGAIARRLAGSGIPWHPLPSLGRDPLNVALARRHLRRLQENEGYHILHAHGRLPARLLRGCSDWSGAPLGIVTAHAAYPTRGMLAGLSHWGERTVAVSEDLRARLCDGFGVPAEAVTVIPNGIDCKRFCPASNAGNASAVLFASRLDRDCSLGAELLLELSMPLKKVFPGFTLTVAGGGSCLGGLLERGEALNRAVGCDFIRFTGRVERMEELMRLHGIFVGVSRAAMEAAACGCAVVLCGNEGFGGFLTPENAVPSLSNFCCRGMGQGNARLLAEHLALLLAHPKTASALAARGRAWITEEYAAERVVQRYEAQCKAWLRALRRGQTQVQRGGVANGEGKCL